MGNEDVVKTSLEGKKASDAVNEGANQMGDAVRSLREEIAALTKERDQLRLELSQSQTRVEQLELCQETLATRLDDMEDMILNALNEQ